MFPGVVHRAHVRRWLLDLEWSDERLHLSDAVLTYTDADDVSTEYDAGLDWAGSAPVDLDFGTVGEALSPSLTLWLPEIVDVAASVAAGYQIPETRARLWLWLEGTTRRILVADGYLDAASYGGTGEPLTCSIRPMQRENVALFPPELARIDAKTFPTSLTREHGIRYPWIIGQPGAGTVFVTPGIWAKWGATDYLLIAGHEVAAGEVAVINDSDQTTQAGLAVVEVADDRGRVVSLVALTGTAVTVSESASYYVKWTTGGGYMRRGTLMTGLGDVLHWALEQCGIPVDYRRVKGVTTYLNAWRLAGIIHASPEQRIDMLDWIRSELLPLAPLSLLHGEDGLYPVVWPWGRTDAAIAADLDTARGDFERLGPIDYSARDAIRNEHRIAWGAGGANGNPASVTVITGDREATRNDTSAFLHSGSLASVTRYGRRVWEGSSAFVWDATTALRCIVWRAEAAALPHRTVPVRLSDRFSGLVVGDVVRITDAATSLDAARGVIVSRPLTDGHWVDAVVRLS